MDGKVADKERQRLVRTALFHWVGNTFGWTAKAREQPPTEPVRDAFETGAQAKAAEAIGMTPDRLSRFLFNEAYWSPESLRYAARAVPDAVLSYLDLNPKDWELSPDAAQVATRVPDPRVRKVFALVSHLWDESGGSHWSARDWWQLALVLSDDPELGAEQPARRRRSAGS